VASVLKALGWLYSKELEFYQKVIEQFENWLSTWGFSLFIMQDNRDIHSIKQILQLYDKTLKAFALWIGLPMIVQQVDAYDEMSEDVRKWFFSWTLYWEARHAYFHENINEGWEDKLNDVASWIWQASPFDGLWGGMELALDTAYKITEDANMHLFQQMANFNFDPQKILYYMFDSLEEKATKNADLVLPDWGWTAIRPFWLAELKVLTAHVQTYMFYKRYFEKKYRERWHEVLTKPLPFTWEIGDTKIKDGTWGDDCKDEIIVSEKEGKGTVDISDQEMKKYKQTGIDFEMKGMTDMYIPPESVLNTLEMRKGELDYWRAEVIPIDEYKDAEGWEGEIIHDKAGLDTYQGKGSQDGLSHFLFEWLGGCILFQLTYLGWGSHYTIFIGHDDVEPPRKDFSPEIEVDYNDPAEYARVFKWERWTNTYTEPYIAYLYTYDGLAQYSNYVFDGDTFFLKDATWVHYFTRLIGVDTPETTTTNNPEEFEGIDKGRLREYGKKATKFSRDFIGTNDVNKQRDSIRPKTGYFDRRLFYVGKGGRDLGLELLKNGLARVYEENDFDRKEEYMDTMEEAKDQGRGMWEYL